MLLALAARDAELTFGTYPTLPIDPERPPTRSWRIHTDRRMTADELAMSIRGMLGRLADEITALSVLSTVPALRLELRTMLGKYYPSATHLLIEPGVRTGVPLLVDNPKEVGPDRLVNALAAHRLYPDTPCIVVDFGTAIVVDAVSARGELLGGAYAPGIGTAVDSLASEAAALQPVELARPRSVIGKTTVECLQSGILYGFAACVDGLVQRMAGQLSNSTSPTVVASGALPPVLLEETRSISVHRRDLTLLGLALACERNNRR